MLKRRPIYVNLIRTRRRQKPLHAKRGFGICRRPANMRPCHFSRVLWVGAFLLALHTQTPPALAGGCDEGIDPAQFQDNGWKPKDKKDKKPPHQLKKAECEGCQKFVDDLQKALDDCNAKQIEDIGKIDYSDTSDANSEKQKQQNAAKDALGGKNVKPPKGKTQKDLKEEVKKKWEALKGQLGSCTNAKTGVAPKPEGGTSPTTGGGGEEPGTGEKPGGGVGAPPGEEVLPTLPKCWPDKATKEKFYKDLKGVDEELQSDIEMSDHFDPKRKSQGATKILAKMKEAKALREAADKLKDCPEPEKTPSGKTAFDGGAGDNCAFLLKEGKIKIDDRGTGETIGHVADLIIENLTDQPLVCVVPPMVLESGSGKNQHYACLESHTVTIDPHGKVTVPMKGVCIARNKPPVGQGVTGDLMINEGNPAIAQNPNSHISTKDTGDLLRLCSSKYKAAEKLQKDGAFKDFPYHDKQKQLDIVVQWLVWSDPRICEIAGAPPAKKEDFKKVIYKQVEEHGPMTTDTKKKIDKGADTMWDGIELAGAKAKDLEPEETPSDGSTTEEGVPPNQPEYVGQTQAKQPTPTPAKPKPGGGKTTSKEKTTPKPAEPPKTEPKKEEPKGETTGDGNAPQTEEKPKEPPTIPSYPFTKETDCGTITISVGEKGELVFDFQPKKDPKCPCKEFGWIQHLSNADYDAWHYDNGVLSAGTGTSKTGAKSDPSLPKQPTTPPKGKKLKDWDNNPWYGGTTDPKKPKDFDEHPTPQTHVSDKPDAPNTKYKMQLVCVATGEVLFTWEWGPFEKGNEAVDKVGGKSVSPP
jgi:hypothetical protein